MLYALWKLARMARVSWPCAITCHCDALACYSFFDSRSSRLEHNIGSKLARQTVNTLCMMLHLLNFAVRIRVPRECSRVFVRTCM